MSDNLIIAYHGTNAVFDKFDVQYLKQGYFGKGFYFYSTFEEAKNHGSLEHKATIVKKCAINIVPHYVYNDYYCFQYLLEGMDKHKIEYDKRKTRYLPYHSEHLSKWLDKDNQYELQRILISPKYKNLPKGECFTEILRLSGYRGIIVPHFQTFEDEEYIVFSPDDISIIEDIKITE